MAAISGSVALIALASRLGIAKGAKIIAEKGFKYLQKRVTKAQKQVTKTKGTTEKGYRGKGSKRQQEKVTQRKKNIPSGLSIE